jgi:hypothetical protein
MKKKRASLRHVRSGPFWDEFGAFIKHPIDCISDGEQELKAFSLFATNEVPTIVRRRLESKSPEITDQERSQWANFVTRCIEDAMKAFKEERMRNSKPFGKNKTFPEMIKAPTLHQQRPLVDTLAQDEAVSFTPATDRSPYFSTTEEQTELETADIGQGPTPAVTWGSERSCTTRESIQAINEGQHVARLGKSDTFDILQGPTPAATLDLNC